MSTDYNYGPPMNFEEIRQSKLSLKTVNSEYLDINGFRSHSMGTPLGHHWKKISSSDAPSIRSCIPSPPRTSSSLMSPSDSTDIPSMGSLKLNEKNRSSNQTSYSGSSDSSSTMHGNAAVSISQVSDSLRQSTEAREEIHCLQLQMGGLEELKPTVEDFTDQLGAMYQQQLDVYYNASHAAKKKFNHLEKSIQYVDETVEETAANYEKTAHDFADVVNETSGLFHRKEKVEQFVRETENFPVKSTRVMTMMDDSLKMLETIRKNVEDTKPEVAPMTVCGSEDARLKAVFDCLVEMVNKLPLDENERRDFNYAIKKIEKDLTFEYRPKCQHIIRQVMTLMSNWEGIKSSSSCFDTSDWNSVGTVSSTSDVLTHHSVMESSSFALTNDSNLNDLEGAVRSAAIRVAVEGPNQVYECGPWNTSSILNSDSSYGQNSIQSHNTPKTLSSYVMATSIGQSTCSSLSKSSMPTFEEAHQSLMKSASRCSLKTAYSCSDPILTRPPRSFDEKSLLQSSTGTRTSMQNPPSLNFSTVSLSEMVEDALHTAKDAAEYPAVSLLEALQNSARKCGAVASELMTAVSTSSESISDTQSSHSSITH